MSEATKRIVAAVSVPFLLLGATVSFAAQPEPADPKAAEPRKDYAAEYHPPLKDNAKPIPDLLIYGPDAPEQVKFEPAGLRITLPLGYPRARPGTGVVTDFGVKGDFEITIAYEIPPEKNLAAPTSYATLRLWVVPNDPVRPEVWHKANQNRAGLGREIIGANGVGRFHADAVKFNADVPRDKWGNEDFSNIEVHIAKRSANTAVLTGRLRLVRNGAQLIFFTSEDADKDFKFLTKYDFGTKDLKNVRVLAHTGTSGDAIEVLVTDLHIRADGFVKGVVTAPPQPPAAEPRSLAVPIVIALALLGVLTLAVPLGLWFYLRKRSPEVPPKSASSSAGALVFACSRCGKKIKTKPERAGKMLKCPQCGHAIKAPEDAEEVP